MVIQRGSTMKEEKNGYKLQREKTKTENPQTELSLLHMSNPFLKITNQQSSAKFSGLRTVYMLGSVHALVTVEQC